MRIISVIFLSLMFVLQGHAFACVVDACHDAAEACEAVELALDCCPTETSEPDGCYETNTEPCSSDCEFETHTHEQVILLQQGTQVALPVFALLSVLEFESRDTSNLIRPIATRNALEPPGAKLSVNYCIWLL